MAEPKTPVGPPAPTTLKPFSFDAAIERQLEKAPKDSQIALVITGEKVAGQNAVARAALVGRTQDGRWEIKAYVQLEEHQKPTIGGQVIFSK